MAWRFQESWIVPQRMDETSTTQLLPLGTTVRAQDDNNNAGEFIYLVGIASTAAKDWVTYDVGSYVTTRLVAAAVGPVAVAMSANVASQYGWYQISGRAEANASSSLALATGALLYATATAGIVDDAVVSGDRVYGAVADTAKTTAVSTFQAFMSRPWVVNEDPTP